MLAAAAVRPGLLSTSNGLRILRMFFAPAGWKLYIYWPLTQKLPSSTFSMTEL